MTLPDDLWFRRRQRATRLKMWVVCALALLCVLTLVVMP